MIGLWWKSKGMICRFSLHIRRLILSGLGRPSALQDTLSDNQKALLALIEDASIGRDEGRISYRSEWLGYMPYGRYHWIEVDGRDVSSQVLDMDCLLVDLQRLVTSRKLQLVNGDFDEWRNDTSEDLCIEFTLIRP